MVTEVTHEIDTIGQGSFEGIASDTGFYLNLNLKFRRSPPSFPIQIRKGREEFRYDSTGKPTIQRILSDESREERSGEPKQRLRRNSEVGDQVMVNLFTVIPTGLL
jgi:hypothetical protein